jgi:translation initiation factor 2 beta subunit (eIF-2beta)/eIF-5
MKNIHVLPTDKPSRFFITNEDEYGYREHYAPDTMQTIKCMNMHIISEEEIKVGDWFIHPDSSCFNKECKEVSIGGYEILQVIKVDENFIYHSAMMAIHKNKNIKKIILTTDQGLIENGVQAIEDKFLEWFVKNPSCESVEIQCRYNFYAGQDLTHYKIIIPREEMSKRVKINFESINKERYEIIPPEKVEESRERIKQNMKTFLKKINNKNSNNLNNGC